MLRCPRSPWDRWGLATEWGPSMPPSSCGKLMRGHSCTEEILKYTTYFLSKSLLIFLSLHISLFLFYVAYKYFSIFNSCCGEYGHIYKPDRPITAMDMQLKQVGLKNLNTEKLENKTLNLSLKRPQPKIGVNLHTYRTMDDTYK